jgi:phosphatidylglycerophosphatase A
LNGQGRWPLARVLSSCFGLGCLRPAPGTIGSAFALVIFVFLLADQPVAVQVLATIVASAAGVWASTATARQLALEDPSEVVIDELAGMWLAAISVSSPVGWTVAFFAFRLFDIVKPFPARQMEALPEGWGIMLDDLVAGAYAWLLVQALLLWGVLS